MAEQPKSFTELLADKYIDKAGQVERGRRGFSGMYAAEGRNHDRAALARAAEATAEPRAIRAARVEEFLTSCGIVAGCMGKYGKPPVPDTEIRSHTRLTKRRGTGWLIWSQTPQEDKAHPQGVLLNMRGKPIAYSGESQRVSFTERQGIPLEVRRLESIATQELTAVELLPPEPYDVCLYMNGLVELAFNNDIPVEKINNALHRMRP